MRLLVVCYQFPPNANPRAVRWGAIVRRWAELGHTVDVVCGPGEDVPKTPGLHVHRVAGWFDRMRHRFRRARPHAGPSEQPSKCKGRSLLGTIKSGCLAVARGLHDHTYARLRWPDYAGTWIAPATRAARGLLAEHRYDALVTVSNPFSDHVVGRTLNAEHPDQWWLADIGDPFTHATNNPHNSTWLYGWANRRLEESILDRADVTTTVTDSTVAAFAEWFPGHTTRMRVVPPILIDAPPPVARQLDPERRALVFSGMLFRRLRNPTRALRIFARLAALPEFADLDLHFFGNVADCRREFREVASLVGSRIHLHGEVPHDVVWQALGEAHVLLNLGIAIRFGLPSKLLEYSQAGRPILHLGFQDADPAIPYLAGHGAGLCLDVDDVLENGAGFARLVRFLREPPVVDPTRVDRLTAPHRIENVAARYLELLNEPAARLRAA